MIWSFSTLGCPGKSLDEAMLLAKRFGLAALEIRTLCGNNNLVENLKARFGSPEQAAEEVDALALPICALDSSVRVITPTEEDRSELLSLAPWADALKVPSIRVFDGRPKQGAYGAQHKQRAREFFSWWRQAREDKGWRVDIMVETHDILLSTRSIERFQADLPSPVAILWDTHHTWVKGGENPITTWNAIKHWVTHIHVKDKVLPREGLEAAFALPGQGDFPYPTLLTQLVADNFTGAVSLEWEKYWKPELPELEQALEACAQANWWNTRPKS